MIEWIEPRPGIDKDGTHVTCWVTVKATNMAGAEMQRASILASAIERGKLPVHMEEAELIEDFITVHQARRVQE